MSKPKKKKINSRAKGCRGELEFCEFLKRAEPEFFADAHRSQQHCGAKGGAADITCTGLDELGLYPEVKRVEAGNPYNWLEQARHDAAEQGRESAGFVAHKRNGKDWMIIMDAKEFFTLIKDVSAPVTLFRA